MTHLKFLLVLTLTIVILPRTVLSGDSIRFTKADESLYYIQKYIDDVFPDLEKRNELDRPDVKVYRLVASGTGISLFVETVDGKEIEWTPEKQKKVQVVIRKGGDRYVKIIEDGLEKPYTIKKIKVNNHWLDASVETFSQQMEKAGIEMQAVNRGVDVRRGALQGVRSFTKIHATSNKAAEELFQRSTAPTNRNGKALIGNDIYDVSKREMTKIRSSLRNLENVTWELSKMVPNNPIASEAAGNTVIRGTEMTSLEIVNASTKGSSATQHLASGLVTHNLARKAPSRFLPKIGRRLGKHILRGIIGFLIFFGFTKGTDNH